MGFIEGALGQDEHSVIKIDIGEPRLRKAFVVANAYCVDMKGRDSNGDLISKRSLTCIRDVVLSKGLEDISEIALKAIERWDASLQKSSDYGDNLAKHRSGRASSLLVRSSSMLLSSLRGSGRIVPMKSNTIWDAEARLVLTILHYLWNAVSEHPPSTLQGIWDGVLRLLARYAFSTDILEHSISFSLLEKIKEKFGYDWTLGGRKSKGFAVAMEHTIRSKKKIVKRYCAFRDAWNDMHPQCAVKTCRNESEKNVDDNATINIITSNRASRQLLTKLVREIARYILNKKILKRIILLNLLNWYRISRSIV